MAERVEKTEIFGGPGRMELAIATFYQPHNNAYTPTVSFRLREFMTGAGDMLEIEIFRVEVVDRVLGEYKITGKIASTELWVKVVYSIHRYEGTIEFVRRPSQ